MADPLFRNPNPEEPFREPIAKLAKLITDRTPVVLGLEKIDKESPEYIGLSMMCTDEMAEMALLMDCLLYTSVFCRISTSLRIPFSMQLSMAVSMARFKPCALDRAIFRI